MINENTVFIIIKCYEFYIVSKKTIVAHKNNTFLIPNSLNFFSMFWANFLDSSVPTR